MCVCVCVCVQIACQKSFNGRFNVEDEDVVTNPNDYFDKAMALAEQQGAAGAGGAAPSGLTAEQRTQIARNKAAAMAKAKAKQLAASAGGSDAAQKGDPSAGMGQFFAQPAAQ